jgi:hypothetical protein
MKINTLTLANASNVLLLENTFPEELNERLNQLCDQVDTDPAWKNPEWTKLRKIYNGTDTAYTDMREYLSSKEFTAPIEEIIKQKMFFVDAAIWADYPDFGPLLPHFEQHGSGQGQIYLSRKQYDTNGTAIMNDDKELLFTLPFKGNYGWYFDECTKVMHSRPYDVIHNTVRCSLIFWHNYI